MQEVALRYFAIQGWGNIHVAMYCSLFILCLACLATAQEREVPQKPLSSHQDNLEEDNLGTMKLFPTRIAALTLSLAQETLGFNAPSDVPSWCGKPYQATSHSLDPGGQFQFPLRRENPLLYVTIQPRFNIFIENDNTGSFIIDASLSNFFGQTYKNSSFEKSGNEIGTSFMAMNFKILSESGAILTSGSVAINSTGNLFDFPLVSFSPRLSPYSVSFHGSSPDRQQTFTASTEIYVLPSRTFGSAVKIDNLYGGLYVQNAKNDWKDWYPIFPNGGYADGGYLTPSNLSMKNLNHYSALGFNTVNIVPDGGLPDQSYPMDELSVYWDRMDELNLFNLYDLRFAFQNTTRIYDQVELWKNRTTLLMWYTADEPDGWMYNLNSTKLAYDELRKLDPYHPVSLVLNCQNFFYKEYSSGANIIFEDAYPVSINATFSRPWGIPCNSTYGDCGCDNCAGELKDVATRLDDLQDYQENIEGGGKKPTWAVVQAFGNQDYWNGIPSVAEVENMMMLAVNHDAKGITYWLYPAIEEVNVGSGVLGKVFQEEPALEFLFGANTIKSLKIEGEIEVEASAWIVGREMMVGIAGANFVDFDGLVTILLPESAKSIDQILYGDSGWKIKDKKLSRTGMKALEVAIVIVNLD